MKFSFNESLKNISWVYSIILKIILWYSVLFSVILYLTKFSDYDFLIVHELNIIILWWIVFKLIIRLTKIQLYQLEKSTFLF